MATYRNITLQTLGAHRLICAALRTSVLTLLVWSIAAVVQAQPQPDGVHSLYPHINNAPNGYLGRLHASRNPHTHGYFQPIEIKAVPELLFAWADQGTFADYRPAPLTLGLLVAPVYRLKVTGLPGDEAAALYPTVELLDRLYPPPGQAAKFPIPIEITIEDLRLAQSGQFVTRVIYVEDPDQALPFVSDPNRPQWFDAGKTANPLDEADRLGRPIAILRIGGRQPDDRQGTDAAFLNGSPPLIVFSRRGQTVVQEPVAPAANAVQDSPNSSSFPRRRESSSVRPQT